LLVTDINQSSANLRLIHKHAPCPWHPLQASWSISCWAKILTST